MTAERKSGTKRQTTEGITNSPIATLVAILSL